MNKNQRVIKQLTLPPIELEDSQIESWWEPIYFSFGELIDALPNPDAVRELTNHYPLEYAVWQAEGGNR